MKDPRSRGRVAAGSFLLSACSSIGLMAVYAFGGQPQIEGTLIFLSLGSMAVGFIVWAKDLGPSGDQTEDRPSMEASDAAQDAAFDEFEAGLERRSFIGRALGAAVGALGLAAVFPIRSLGQAPGDRLLSTAFRSGVRLVTPDGAPVRAGDLQVGGFLTVFPEGATDAADSQAVLIRVGPGELSLPEDRETWAPDGHIAYSQICTHAGCPVTLYEPETAELLCPCHQSIFKVTDSARATYGPATRALPQLPIGVDAEGYLVALGDFSEPVGPAFWELG